VTGIQTTAILIGLNLLNIKQVKLHYTV